MKFLVQYSREGEWIPFQIFGVSIYEIEAWVKANVQSTGICITRLHTEPTQPEQTLGEWSLERILQRARSRAYAAAQTA